MCITISPEDIKTYKYWHWHSVFYICLWISCEHLDIDNRYKRERKSFNTLHLWPYSTCWYNSLSMTSEQVAHGLQGHLHYLCHLQWQNPFSITPTCIRCFKPWLWCWGSSHALNWINEVTCVIEVMLRSLLLRVYHTCVPTFCAVGCCKYYVVCEPKDRSQNIVPNAMLIKLQ